MKKLFKQGDRVPDTGIYASLHSTPHALISEHEHVEGAEFPYCYLCPNGVWYRSEHLFPASSKGLTGKSVAIEQAVAPEI